MEPGTVVMERYRIEAVIGRGGMGTVFKARDADGRWVAVKSLHAPRGSARQRFEREAHILSELVHPAIVRCLDVGVGPDGQPILVMEWLQGMDLAQRLSQGPLDVGPALVLGARLASALAVAHGRGVIHRDLKPGNVFLPDGQIERAKLLDFGVSHVRGATTLTRAGTLMGTPLYMAPEQIRGERELTGGLDIFALGCVLYECLTGRAPFAGPEIMATFYKILLEEPPSLSRILEGVPRALEDLLACTLAKEATRRPSDAARLAARFEQLATHLADVRLVQVTGASASSDALTRRERHLVSVVVLGDRRAFSAWIRQQNGGGAPDSELALAQTVAEEASWQALRARHQESGVRFAQLGDGSLMALFETRRTATDRAAAAARFALALRVAVSETPISVATGLVERAGAQVLGAVIDRSIDQLAGDRASEVGAIILDETTAGLLGDRFAVAREAGGLCLLGERKDGPSFRLMGQPTPFVGRRRELAMLTSTLDECIEEHRAQAVLVTGAAGLGKSRLRHEFGRGLMAGAYSIQVWRARCDPISAGAPLHAMSQMVRQLIGPGDGRSLAERRTRLQERVARSVPLEEQERVSLFLGELAACPWPDGAHVQLAAARKDPRLMGDQLRRAFTDFVRWETESGPVLIEIEDLHWSDRATVAMVDDALRLLPRRPLLVIAYARAEVHELFPELWARRERLHIALRPLSPSAAGRLARAVLGEQLSSAILDKVAHQADGNPLYLEELLRSAAVGGETAHTVLAMLQVRLQASSAGARQILRAASIFGDRFEVAGVRALLGQTMAVDRLLEVVQQEEWIVPVDHPAEEGGFSFRHDLVRAAAYGLLTEEDRALGHRLAGAWLEQSSDASALVLAEHFERGGQPELAVPHLARAARSAMEASDLDGVLTLAQRGIACGAQGETLGWLRALRAEAYVWQGAFEQAMECANAALPSLVRGTNEWYLVHNTMIHAASKLGRNELVGELSNVVTGGRAQGHDYPGWMLVATGTAGMFLLSERRAEAKNLLRLLEREVVASEADNPDTLGLVHAVKAIEAALVHDDHASNLRECRLALTAFERSGNHRASCMTLGNAGLAAVSLGLYADADEMLCAALARAEALALRDTADAARLSLSDVRRCEHRLEEAASLAREATTSFLARGVHRQVIWGHLALARCHLAAGELEPAGEHAREAIRQCSGMLAIRAYALAILAAVELALELWREAASTAAEAVELLREHGVCEAGEIPIRLVHARALHATGCETAARRAIREAREHLLECAARIHPVEWRQTFLYNVPENARTLELAERWTGTEPIG